MLSFLPPRRSSQSFRSSSCVGDDPLFTTTGDAGPGLDSSTVVDGNNEAGPNDAGPTEAALTLVIDPTSMTVAPGGYGIVKVRIVRGPGVVGTAVLSISDPDLAPLSAEIPSAEDRVDLRVATLGTAALGSRIVKVKGVVGSKNAEADLSLTFATTSGGFDPTFGDGGVVALDAPMTDGGAYLHSVVATADGGVVVSGDMASPMTPTRLDSLVVKLDPDGTPTRAFGSDGVATLSNGVTLRSVAVETSGAIVAGGWRGNFASAEALFWSPSGTSPISTSLPFEKTGFSLSALSGPNTRYVGGTTEGGFRVWQLTASGGVETYAGTLAYTGVPKFPGAATKLRLDASNRVVAAVDTSIVGGSVFSHVGAARFLTTGAPDGTFGNDKQAHAGLFLHAMPGKSPFTVSIDRIGDGWLIPRRSPAPPSACMTSRSSASPPPACST